MVNLWKNKPSKLQRQNYIEKGYGDEERWQKARKKRLELDGYKCTSVGCDNTTRLEIDHIIPISKGGSRFALSNLRTLCKGCHDKRHAYSHRYIRGNSKPKKLRRGI